MSTTTPKLGLTKPAGTEFIDEAIINNNMDLIDAYAISNDLAVRQNPYSHIHLAANLAVANASLAVQFNGTGTAYAGKGLTIAVSGANGRFTTPTAGWYRFGFNFMFTDANATGSRAAYLIDITNGGPTVRKWEQPSDSLNQLIGDWPILCTSGQIFEIHPYQSTGSSRNLSGSATDDSNRSYITAELMRSAT